MRNGNAPYSSVTGFHDLPYMNFNPIDFREGIEVMASVKNIATKITTTLIAANKRTLRKSASLKFIPLKFFNAAVNSKVIFLFISKGSPN